MSFLLPGVAAAVVAVILLLLDQSITTVLLGAAAIFPAVYLLLQQTTTGKQGGGGQQGKGLLEEEEERAARKDKKKQKKVDEAKKKDAARVAAAAEKEKEAAAAAKGKPAAASAGRSEDDEDEENDDDESEAPAAGGAEQKKALTKTAQKKAKKEAAKKKEEERVKAEAEAKKKVEEAEKKKNKKKKAKKTDGETAASTTADASPSSSSQQSKAQDDGWEVQKSDKPSSNKPASTKGQSASAASATAAKTADSTATAAKSASKKGDAAAAGYTPESYEEMYIPFKFHAQLIGAKGATLQQLQTGSGARIDMPKKDSGSTKVQIVGSSEAVAAAKGAIDSLMTKGYSTLTHPGYVHDDLSVPDDKMGHIIGPSGAYIKAIQDKTKTRINLPDKDSGSNRVTVVGKKEDVRSARLAIKELLVDGYSPLTHENFIKKEVAFPADKLHILIGAKGQTIKSIQGNSKARIRIPDRSSAQGQHEALIAVVGTPEQVAQAEREIKRLLIPVTVVEEEPEEEYVNGTWSEAGPTEDELWE